MKIERSLDVLPLPPTVPQVTFLIKRACDIFFQITSLWKPRLICNYGNWGAGHHFCYQNIWVFITCAFACAWFTVFTDHLPLKGVFKFIKVSKSNFDCKEYNNCLTHNFCQVNKTLLQTISVENLLNRLDSTSTHSWEVNFSCNIHKLDSYLQLQLYSTSNVRKTNSMSCPWGTLMSQDKSMYVS